MPPQHPESNNTVKAPPPDIKTLSAMSFHHPRRPLKTPEQWSNYFGVNMCTVQSRETSPTSTTSTNSHPTTSYHTSAFSSSPPLRGRVLSPKTPIPSLSPLQNPLIFTVPFEPQRLLPSRTKNPDFPSNTKTKENTLNRDRELLQTGARKQSPDLDQQSENEFLSSVLPFHVASLNASPPAHPLLQDSNLSKQRLAIKRKVKQHNQLLKELESALSPQNQIQQSNSIFNSFFPLKLRIHKKDFPTPSDLIAHLINKNLTINDAVRNTLDKYAHLWKQGVMREALLEYERRTNSCTASFDRPVDNSSPLFRDISSRPRSPSPVTSNVRSPTSPSSPIATGWGYC